MNTTNIKRVIYFGLINYWRNRWLSLASVLVLSLTLITISISLIQNIDIQNTIASINEKIDMSVYFDDKASEADIQDIQLKLQSRPDIKSVDYISKEDALQKWRNRPTSQKIKDLVTPESNPLPRSLQIKTYSTDSQQTIANLLDTPRLKDIIRRVSYQDTKKIIEDLNTKNNEIRKTGLVSSLTFVFISLIVIINTIRTIILTRREEIEIMRLVGASDFFIKMPFLVEALLTAFIASFLSTAFIFVGIEYNLPIVPYFISRYFSDLSAGLPEIILHNLGPLFVLQFLFAFLLTVITTFLSLRRHLRT